MRVEVRRPRQSARDRSPRAPSLAALLWWAHRLRQRSGSVRRLGPPLTSSAAQIDQTTRLATSRPASPCHARGTAPRARRERVRLRECARDRGAGQCSAQGVLCAVSVAPGSQTGRLCCVRISAVMVVCGMSCAVVAQARTVSRRAIGHRSAVRPAGCRRARGQVRGVVWGLSDALVMCGPPRTHTGG